MLTKSLLIGVCYIASTTAKLQFALNGDDLTFQAGQQQSIKWSGSDTNQPVSLYLYRGDSKALEPSNAIVNITTTATGSSYVWSVPESLVNAHDYQLEITQSGSFNYQAGVTIAGSTASSSSASGSASASATASSSSSHTVVGGGSHGSNSTAPSTTAASNSSATAVGTAASAGTATSIHRNQTMSKASLSRHSATSTVSFTTGSASTPSSTSDSSSSSSPAPTSKSGAMELASNFALVLAGVAAVIYIG